MRSMRFYVGLGVVIGVIILVALAFIPLPYYIFSPGSANPLAPMITVSGGHKTEKGEFMMTTVSVLYAQNIYEFLYGLTIPHRQILPESLVSSGLPDPEYTAIESYMMYTSHQNSKIAAFRYLHLPLRVTPDGVYVVYVASDSTATEKLRDGDVITGLNGHKVTTAQGLIDQLGHDRPGQVVRLAVKRGHKTLPITVRLTTLPPLPGHKGARAGIGILPGAANAVTSPYRVTINTGNIDGPSAGFMFSLEIVNQLYRGGDLTRGYKIAGTGTISADGTIGQIGGIQHKVIAASAEGATYFFAPKDRVKGDTNQLHAEQTAQNLHLPIKVIPVHTLADAIHFLMSLPPKSGKIA